MVLFLLSFLPFFNSSLFSFFFWGENASFPHYDAMPVWLSAPLHILCKLHCFSYYIVLAVDIFNSKRQWWYYNYMYS